MPWKQYYAILYATEGQCVTLFPQMTNDFRDYNMNKNASKNISTYAQFNIGQVKSS